MRDVVQALRRQRLHELDSWLERLVIWGGAAGLGLVTVLFARLSEHLGQRFHDFQTHQPWLPLVLTPIGGNADRLRCPALVSWYGG